MKQNGNHHASAILRTFTQGNLRQRTGNFNSFLAMYGTPRYPVTSRITRLILITFRMEVVSYDMIRMQAHGAGGAAVRTLTRETLVSIASCVPSACVII
ncbi:predicted protein [Ostreococcus lucimarinus CCE9901]|uniref:Uncharacterized protein n=1 Tax=Ostreococcus lucimarinus (strain CCE9901) TaxID=436017 RepID=A4RSZ1_OSTLU|nr:predicted protein [Ostreococcus lucimarinus CCE9901]ABO94701.1 predicted protein [Ostreococcus lucimarinus CCE9901]|eukprot:XP_001416408.1 predicted protein [Ostreococcus lucimarinus CCE9901]